MVPQSFATADIHSRLQAQTSAGWLLELPGGWTLHGDRVLAQFEENLAQLNRLKAEGLKADGLKTDGIRGDRPPRILLIESEPEQFLAGFLAAVAAECPVFLGNPTWRQAEWAQVLPLARPDVVWKSAAADFLAEPLDSSSSTVTPVPQQTLQEHGWIMVPTGGSSGQIRFAIHTWDTLSAAVEGFQRHFQMQRVNSVCVLPLYHVSGLMQVLRCFLSGGRVAIAPFKAFVPSNVPFNAPFNELATLDFDPAGFFLSLVPTQLQRLLDSPAHLPILKRFHTILLGGAPAWPELLSQGRSHGLRLAPTYGMTETAAQIATLMPDEFLQGHTSSGRVLPHAQLTIRDGAGIPLGAHQTGMLEIRARSLALGYYPEQFFPNRGDGSRVYSPDDVGFLDDHGELHIVGRTSDKIITGGENVFPAEVEAAIRATGQVRDVAVIGVGDRHWGEVVTALYVPLDEAVTLAQLEAQLSESLAPYKRPKRWIRLDCLPRNAQGKLNRQYLHQLRQSSGQALERL